MWKFIPHMPPGMVRNMRLMALVKKCLKKSYGHVLLSCTQLTTALCETEDTINNWPLTYVEGELLTPPNHFLRRQTVNANCSLEAVKISPPSTWRIYCKAGVRITKVVEAFWQVFRNHYLLSLRERHSAFRPPKKGSV